jgi:AcrR family transcriptional regulator
MTVEDKRAALYSSARELFAERGFKDTSVADITRLAGVAVGTFYIHYPSKDRLFIEIFKDENERLIRGLTESIDCSGEPKAVVRVLLQRNLEGMLANPILRQWYDPNSSARIERLFREQDGMSAASAIYHRFIDLVAGWQAEGRMRADIDPVMIMAIFGAIIRIGHYREEIGKEFFPALQDHMTDFVMDGLTRGMGQGRAAEKQ